MTKEIPNNNLQKNLEPTPSITHTYDVIFNPVEVESFAEIIGFCTELYFSPEDQLHQFRREKALKKQTFTDPEELTACLNDSNVTKIITRDHEGKLIGVSLITNNPETLPLYSPTHLIAVDDVEGEAILPFLRGSGDTPGHYQKILSESDEDMRKYLKRRSEQAFGLPTTLSPHTSLEKEGIETLLDHLKESPPFFLIDQITSDQDRAASVYESLKTHLREVSTHPTIIFHAQEGEEIFPDSPTNHFPISDTISSQAYWITERMNPLEKRSSLKLAAPPIKEGHHPITMQRVQLDQLAPRERQSLLDEFINLEKKCFYTPDPEKSSLGKHPLTTTVAEQRYSPEDIKSIVKATDAEMVIYTYMGGENKNEIVGYLAFLTGEGTKNPDLKDLFSDNPQALSQFEITSEECIHIINFLILPQYRKQVTGEHFVNWLHHLVLPDALPDGGYIFSNTDVNLTNLRLLQLLVWPDIIDRWRILKKLSPKVESLFVAGNIALIRLLDKIGQQSEIDKRLTSLQLQKFFISQL